jgi:hypothetical protein
VKHGRFFYSKAKDCARCPLKGDCLSKGRVNKVVVVGDDYCSEPGVAVSDGASKIDNSISDIAGGQKDSMARPNPGMASRELSGAVSQTCAFKRI